MNTSVLEDKYQGGGYIIVEYDECYRSILVEEVNDLMTLGYMPIGGLSVRVGSSCGATLMQAMIKTK